MIGPDVCLSRSYSRGVLPAGPAQLGGRPGTGRPAVTISDPLGGTLMLNPNSVSSGAASLGTRIQVGQKIYFFLTILKGNNVDVNRRHDSEHNDAEHDDAQHSDKNYDAQHERHSA
jgi:hypothetical protein